MTLLLSALGKLCSTLPEQPNGNGISRAQGMPTNQNDDHAKHLSQKARVSASAGCRC
jgi:hypothetical protein